MVLSQSELRPRGKVLSASLGRVRGDRRGLKGFRSGVVPFVEEGWGLLSCFFVFLLLFFFPCVLEVYGAVVTYNQKSLYTACFFGHAKKRWFVVEDCFFRN